MYLYIKFFPILSLTLFPRQFCIIMEVLNFNNNNNNNKWLPGEEAKCLVAVRFSFMYLPQAVPAMVDRCRILYIRKLNSMGIELGTNIHSTTTRYLSLLP